MLLQMHVLGPHRGVLAVVGTTVVAVGAGLLGRTGTDSAIGFVLGPVIGAAVAVVVMLGLEALARESEERRRTVEELTEVREHLAEAERDAAVAGERERLAREIHDTLAQGYSAIELLLRAAEAQHRHGRRRGARLRRAGARHGPGEPGRGAPVRAGAGPADLDAATLVEAVRRVARRTQDDGRRTGRCTCGCRPRAPRDRCRSPWRPRWCASRSRRWPTSSSTLALGASRSR